jgi:hypothetical protein
MNGRKNARYRGACEDCLDCRSLREKNRWLARRRSRVEEFVQGVRENTPTVFEPNVADTLEITAKPLPEILPAEIEAPTSDVAQPGPPLDPLGEVDPEKSQRYVVASGANALWKVLLQGEKIGKTVEGWTKVVETLGAPIAKNHRIFASHHSLVAAAEEKFVAFSPIVDSC